MAGRGRGDRIDLVLSLSACRACQRRPGRAARPLWRSPGRAGGRGAEQRPRGSAAEVPRAFHADLVHGAERLGPCPQLGIAVRGRRERLGAQLPPGPDEHGGDMHVGMGIDTDGNGDLAAHAGSSRAGSEGSAGWQQRRTIAPDHADQRSRRGCMAAGMPFGRGRMVRALLARRVLPASNGGARRRLSADRGGTDRRFFAVLRPRTLSAMRPQIGG
jgi:hypothetical protein